MTAATTLALDCAGPTCSAAVARGDAVHAVKREVGNAHTRHLLPMVRDVLAAAGLALADCDAIAFGAGPGAFTGLRVACASAQGLALGAGLGVMAVPSLDALAFAAVGFDDVPVDVLVAQDARMGEVYWTTQRWCDGVLRDAAGPFVTPARALRARLGPAAPIAVGCGTAWTVHPDAMAGLATRVIGIDDTDQRHGAAAIARLAQRRRPTHPARHPSEVAPLYVRDDVALTTAERAAVRAAEPAR